MHRWFLARFPEPAAWLAARLAFTRSNAVWCMVGHLLGLGDRHGENITIDGTNGALLAGSWGMLVCWCMRCSFLVGCTLALNRLDGEW